MEENEALWVQRFKNGDETAFNQIVLKHQKMVYNLVLKMIRNTEEAKDLSQEVFVKAYHSLKDFKGDSSLSTWLYKVAYNLSLNYSSREKFRSFLSFSEIEPLASKDSIMDELEKDEINKAIDKAILNLPKKQKGVFVLRYYENLPFAEIARMTNRSEGSVKANFFQALKKLKKSLAQFKVR